MLSCDSVRKHPSVGSIHDNENMTQRRFVTNDRVMFVTTVTRHRAPVFTDATFARAAVEQLYKVQSVRPFFLFGFVIMPDHCHFLVMVPSPGSISRVMQSYKSGLYSEIGANVPLWQKRYYVIFPRNSWSVLRYIHMNPVKAGIVDAPEHYLWSSASGRWDVSLLDVV